MKSLGLFSAHNSDLWKKEKEQPRTPHEYLAELRRQRAQERVDEINAVDAGINAFIDADGDIAFRIHDPDKYIEAMKSAGSSRQLTPTQLISEMNQSLKLDKDFRRHIKEDVEMLRPLMVAKYPRAENILFDFLPSSFVNAGAHPVPSGGDVVTLNDRFTQVGVWCDWIGWHYYDSSNAAMQNIPSVIDDATVKEWQQTYESTFTKTHQLGLAILGAPDTNPIIDRCSQELREVGATSRGGFYSGFLMLIAAFHEFGHVVLGHTDWFRNRLDDCAAGYVPTPSTTADWLQELRNFEYEADAFAAEFMQGLPSESGPTGESNREYVLFWAAQFLFMLFGTVEGESKETHEGNRVAEYIDDVTRDHPNAWNRLSRFYIAMGIDPSAPTADTPLANNLGNP